MWFFVYGSALTVYSVMNTIKKVSYKINDSLFYFSNSNSYRQL